MSTLGTVHEGSVLAAAVYVPLYAAVCVALAVQFLEALQGTISLDFGMQKLKHKVRLLHSVVEKLPVSFLLLPVRESQDIKNESLCMSSKSAMAIDLNDKDRKSVLQSADFFCQLGAKP